MSLTDLNDDELILIFRFCSIIDHRAIAEVCKKFERIIESHFNERRARNLLMVSHMKNYPELFERTLNGAMKYAERLRVHQNWTIGACSQLIFFQHRENYETHLELDGMYLYAACLGELNIYRRRRKYGISTTPVYTAGDMSDSVVTSMKMKGEMLGGSRANGSLFTFTEAEEYNMEYVMENNDLIKDLDFHEDTFVTTTDNDLRFHRLVIELEMLTFDTVETRTDLAGLSTVNFDPTGRNILGSRAGNIYLIDATTGVVLDKSFEKQQIYKTQWIDEHCFLYTSWNSPLALIDTRCVLKPQDFTWGNFTASCIDYDGRYGVLYGTLLGMMILCDLRCSKTFEKVYHLDTATVCRGMKSDESHLFVSTDNSICMLDFEQSCK